MPAISQERDEGELSNCKEMGYNQDNKLKEE